MINSLVIISLVSRLDWNGGGLDIGIYAETVKEISEFTKHVCKTEFHVSTSIISIMYLLTRSLFNAK